jgi:hypothetical protein
VRESNQSENFALYAGGYRHEHLDAAGIFYNNLKAEFEG